MGRAPAGQRAEDGAALRVAAAPAARRQRRGDRHPRARLRAADTPTATSTRCGSSACSTTARAREALALWRGEALADLADEPFAAAEIRRLEELRLHAGELAIDADLAAGRHGEVIGELERADRRSTRCASSCTPGACSRCTAAGARRRPSRPTATRAQCWSSRSASSLAASCGGCRTRSCPGPGARRRRGSAAHSGQATADEAATAPAHGCPDRSRGRPAARGRGR